MATLVGGASAVSSCTEQNNDADENGEKIENAEEYNTSVVFRVRQDNEYGTTNHLLMENGDEIHPHKTYHEIHEGNKSIYLEPGDTVTYKGSEIKAVRYKGGHGKQVNFGKIGVIKKDGGR